MRKKSVLFIICCGIIVSCKKENITLTKKVTNCSQHMQADNLRPIPNQYRIYEWNNGSPYCHDTGGNCLPDIVITPKIYNHLNKIVYFIDSKDNKSLIDYIRNNFNEISEFLDEDLLNDFLSGRSILAKEGDLRTALFIIFANTSYAPSNPETIQFVYPFINE